MGCKIGLLNSVPSSLLCEMFGHVGDDFAVLDLEHALRSPAEPEHAIRACEPGSCAPWARLSEMDVKRVGRVRDAGFGSMALADRRERTRTALRVVPMIESGGGVRAAAPDETCT